VKQYTHFLVTDFDGTLYHRETGIDPEDIETLSHLEGKGVLRCIATGRSHFSLLRALPADFPVDYLIVSTGACIIDFRSGELLWSTALGREETGDLSQRFMTLGFDFMVHFPIPNNHRFFYHRNGKPNADFERRISLYEEFAAPLSGPYDGEATQFLIVEPTNHGIHAEISSLLSQYTVVRTTSPLDHESEWIEVFPRTVSKAQCAERLMNRVGIKRGKGNVLALGNDYNDEDLLRWAETSFIAPGAPPELGGRYPTLPGSPMGFLSRAVRSWLGN